MKLLRGGVLWDSEVHKKLIEKLGGVKAIEEKLKQGLMFGELHYYKKAIEIKDAFEAHNVEFKQ
ncbi:hypothetical protein BJD49_gp074 [Acinetobacter phage vB_AbaM_phiAbaA1]|uniref:hypothetical protein n=1 Tax=Acinetobacter phage vB_AbaM_phiAbaA1 TaxID=1605379 RepID=UPI00078BE681|nr:hypothetical protein BJD49_gp074 [Acinetobacter phage vB_AbaM_phiAbaA1]AJK27216.1 hypothetical protein phiAbaA1_113 [Acinetobacter phage vB_AbaM_phiAbaA1]